ncbi:MAG: hypothetical protein ACRDQI_15945 [Pseudonocardiaceae bacterium]
MQLLTRGPARYRTYFPTVDVIARLPDPADSRCFAIQTGIPNE